MKIQAITALLALTIAYILPVWAQDVLPFPPTPSASEAGLTMETSTKIYGVRVKGQSKKCAGFIS